MASKKPPKKQQTKKCPSCGAFNDVAADHCWHCKWRDGMPTHAEHTAAEAKRLSEAAPAEEETPAAPETLPGPPALPTNVEPDPFPEDDEDDGDPPTSIEIDSEPAPSSW